MSSSDQDQLASLAAAVKELLLRQRQMEQRLETLESALKVPPPVISIPPAPVVIAAEPAEPLPDVPAYQSPAYQLPANEAPALETRVGLTVINRIGAVTLVLGVAFFFKWAVDNDWIGPLSRVVLGLLAGFAALAVADFLWKKAQQVFAQGLTGAGIAIIYVAFYAAFDFYHLTPQAIAFLLLLATTALATAMALRYASMAIALLGLFGAYLVPILLSNGEDHPWFLIGYVLTLNFAAQRLAAARNWFLLDVSSFFLGTGLVFGGWLLRFGTRPEDHWPAVVGVLALYAQRFQSSRPALFLWAQILTALYLSSVSSSRAEFILLSPLVAAAGLAYSHWRRYPALVPIAFVCFWLTAIGWAFTGHASALLDAIGFLLFSAWICWRSAILEEPPAALTLPIFALNGIIFYAATYSSLHRADQEWMGLLAVAVGALYLTFGLLLYRKTRIENDPLILLSLGMAAAFVAVAVPVQLSGFSIDIGWSILAAALAWIGHRLNQKPASAAALLIFGLASLSVILILPSTHLDIHAYPLVLNQRFFSFAVLSIALQLSAHWTENVDREFAIAEFITGHVALLTGLSLETLDWAKSYARPENLLSVETISITILFAIYATVLVSIGVATRSYASRIAGLVLTAIVIAKLYVFDVWQLERVYQIIAFVILGLLLLSTSFLYSRFKNLVAEWSVKERS